MEIRVFLPNVPGNPGAGLLQTIVAAFATPAAGNPNFPMKFRYVTACRPNFVGTAPPYFSHIPCASRQRTLMPSWRGALRSPATANEVRLRER